MSGEITSTLAEDVFINTIQIVPLPEAFYKGLCLHDISNLISTSKTLQVKFTDNAFLDNYGKLLFHHRLTDNTLLEAVENKSVLLRSITQIDMRESRLNEIRILQIIGEMPKLMSLSLYGAGLVGINVFNFISRNLPFLVTLNISRIQPIGEDTMRGVSNRHPHLAALLMQGQLTVTGEFLSDFNALEVLDLSDCTNLQNENLRHIAKNNPQLHTLDLSNVSHLTKDVLLDIAKATTNLKRLILDCLDNVDNEVLITFILNNPRLLHLSIIGAVDVTDESLRALSTVSNSKLRTLELANCIGIHGEHLNLVLRNAPHLRTLNLCQTNSIEVEYFTLFCQEENLDQLVYVGLNDCLWLSNAVLRSFLVIPNNNLKGLDLRKLPSQAAFGDSEMQFLVDGFPHIENLRFSNSLVLTNEGAKQMQRLSRLKLLDMMSCPLISNEGIEPIIKNCPDLYSLSFGFMGNFDDQILNLIKEVLSNQLIDFSLTHMPKFSSQAISSLLSASYFIRFLKLQHMNQMKHNDLLSALKDDHDSLRCLNFSHSEGLGVEYSRDYYDFLPRLSKIEYHWGNV